jgi:iron complex outermembrane receptor protein
MKKVLQFIVPLIFLGNAAWAQEILEGVIKDKEGYPVEGATVVVVGTNSHAVVDSNGRFSFAVSKQPPFTVLVSIIGYQAQEIRVSKSPFKSLNITLVDDNLLSEVVVTSRRRKEVVQDIPIPITVVTGALVEDAGAFNVNRVKELIPSVQLYSSNPRNTGLSIRGLGTTFGLTNDGIDPGVGFYVDGVFYARPAATTLDFIDIEQIEVLRGPQGTLFGKNTTAGALNITTRKPSFKPGANFEVSYGNYGFIQAKASVTGPLSKKLAGRLSFSGTQRDGVLTNVNNNKPVNDLNNQGVRGQLLYTPNEKIDITLSGDISRQRPDGYAQVIAGVAPTQRAAYRQFDQIIADLNYTLPSENAFDRKIDHDTPWRSGQDMGGVSLNADFKIGPGTLTSTTAWRFWNWDPSNDRDFTGLPVLTLSQAPSKHQQWSQELRYAGKFSSRLSGVFGLFAFGQDLRTSPYHTEESGAAQWRFSQNSTSPLWQTPGLFEGYGIRTKSKLNTFSGAAYAQLDWSITERLHVLPGLRFNYDEKQVDFNRQTYGGLQTTDPALLALKRAVYNDQAFTADVNNTNLSGQLTVAYKVSKSINTFATYSTSYKPIGINLGGLPNSGGQPMIELAEIKPEFATHVEFGIKTTPTKNSIVNLVVYNTDIKDYQTQVQAADLSVNRGYLANAEKVRVRGVELDASVNVKRYLAIYGAVAYTEGKYISFTNAPLPLEETGAPVSFKDVSGGALPGISKWAGSLGAEVSTKGNLLGKTGRFFLALDGYYRSSFSSNPSPSKYLVVDGYALLNGRLGFRVSQGTSFFIWGRNILDQNYFEQLLPGAGNAGHYAGVLGDPRTYGVTLRHTF